ncbi:hypothetical protein TWF569_003714 [Orbilia oligospora]|nr:hypothetical protein TWF103_000242 [Orbilia oligospora]KAF3151581.1 hypothetical protein TWF569_003714 [Orbilia oligospora]
MAPLPATSISHEPRDARFAVDASFPRLLHAAERIFKRDLGPSTGQYLAAREHQRAGLAQEAEKELEAAAEEPSS